MLDINYIIHNRAKVCKKLADRGFPNVSGLLKQILEINAHRKEVQASSDALKYRINQHSQQIASLLREKASKEQIQVLKQTIAHDKLSYKVAIEKLKYDQKKLKKLLSELPNLPQDHVPIGHSQADNKVIETWEGPSTMSGALLPHWDLVARYGLVDFEQGTKVAGAGFPIYQRKGAKLQRALIHFFLDQACKKGYQERGVPLLANEASVFGTGQLPDKEGMMYVLQGGDQYLIPTAEVPLTNLYRDALFQAQDLPIKEVAYTPCFRREAGSWGRHVRGLNRLHQFDKVEIVQIVVPDQAQKALQEMCHHVKQLLEQLGLTYRMVQLCTGELGSTAAITYDFEVWSAGQKTWLEVSSVSCFDTYQARRMKIRYRVADKNHYCYTLNGSALALPRVMAALLENHQTSQCIYLPEALHAYTGFKQLSLLDPAF